MREIKFRAWDKEEKEFIKANSLGSLIDTAIGFPETVILMQFTGLKDKNDKEIYEGDIVNFDYSDEQNGYSGNQVVKFAEFEAGFHPFCLRSRWRASIDKIEIIGNIYENPELLK